MESKNERLLAKYDEETGIITITVTPKVVDDIRPTLEQFFGLPYLQREEEIIDSWNDE